MGNKKIRLGMLGAGRIVGRVMASLGDNQAASGNDTVPVGVSVEGDEMKISLGVDLFSSTDSDEGHKWKTFKDLVVTHTDDDTKDIETFCNVYDLAQGHSWKKSNTANKFEIF